MSDFNHVNQLLQDFVARGLPGCALAVAREGRILYQGYHGMASIEAQRPIAEDTVYRLYSMTKIIVCTAALMLAERGKFLLNEPLYEYLPEYRHHTIASVGPDGKIRMAPSRGPMLIRHAFTMGVGLTYSFVPGPTTDEIEALFKKLNVQHNGNFSLRELVCGLAGVPVACEPGERFIYGYGHDLVAALIEAVSGKTVGAFLREELFQPLGMANTGYRYWGDIRERMASAYQLEAGKPPVLLHRKEVRHHEPDARFESGGSGLFSTLGDYLIFAQMLAAGGTFNNQRIISRKTIDLMRQNQLKGDVLARFWNAYNVGYGYGLGVRTMLDTAAAGANNTQGAFGWSGALGTWVEVDPSEGLAVVYMHQADPNLEEYHHLRVRAAVYGAL